MPRQAGAEGNNNGQSNGNSNGSNKGKGKGKGGNVYKKSWQQQKAAGKTNDSTPNSVLQKRIRDASRTLRRPNLTATQKQELERRIKALELEMNKNKQQTQEHKLFQKYKYVRFVEQKKILRQIARTERRLAAVERQGAAPQQGADGDDDDASAGSNDEDGQGDAESLKEALGSLKLRLAYITHYPRDLKYIALFPKEPLAETSPSALMQAQIFEKLRSAMDKGLTERPGFVLRMHNMDATLNADSDDDGQGAQEQGQQDAEMDEDEQEEEQEQEEEGQRRDHSTGDRSASKQDRHAKTSKAQRRAPAGKSGAASATAAGRRKDASSSRADSGQDDDFFL